jgi:hypothetical protein
MSGRSDAPTSHRSVRALPTGLRKKYICQNSCFDSCPDSCAGAVGVDPHIRTQANTCNQLPC